MAMTKQQQQDMVNNSKSYPGKIAGSFYASDGKNPGRYTMGKTEKNFANARPYASGDATKSPATPSPRIKSIPSTGAKGTQEYEFDSYKKGGKVKKTGLALVHKGEKVIPVKNKKRQTSDGYMVK